MNTDPVDPSLAGLNPPQREAVLHDGGPLVVFAGAGSGKTRVITYRVAHLVTELGVAPWNVLAVTFTNKAAREMRTRLERLIGAGPTRDLWVGTFHATCARLLRRYAEAAGIQRNFTIYDQADQLAMVKRVVRDFQITDEALMPKRVAGRIGREKQEVRGPDDLTPRTPVGVMFKEIYAAYETRMKAANALDFSDLIYRLVIALESDDALRGQLQQRFKHLLVDEFQDTNHAQYRLVRAIGAGHRNVTVVGDDDQSIYRWRGADRRNIQKFKEEFGDVHVVKLEQNYRSTQRILRAANAIIQKALSREPKELWTENEEGAAVTVVQCTDERREAELVVESVRQLRIAGRTLEEIALFYRLHAQSRVFEEELRRVNIPYRIIGGMRFYDRAEVKDILAYMRVLANPTDDVSLLRIINVPPRGIGKKSVENLLDRAAQLGSGVIGAIEASSFGTKGAAPKRLAAFRELVAVLSTKLENGEPLAAVGYAVFEDSGYKKWLEDQDTPEADAKKQNVEELLGAIQLAQEDEPELDLPTFLERVTLETDNEKTDGPAEERITLMTVHGAKGLEFPVVIVAGLEENTFPFKRRSELRLDEEELEEERRLAYVALTRAQERLMLTWAERRFMFRERYSMTPSRFISELPEDDVHWVGKRRVATAPLARTRPRRAFKSPQPVVASGDSYVDRSEGSDFEGETIHVGMPVRHRKFGLGRILQIKPSTPPRVDVEFENRDVRTIQVSYLTPA